MEAVLLTRDISSSKHTGVISCFNQHFIKTGIFPKSFSKTISRLFRERQVGDYGFYIDISEDEILKNLKLAGDLLDKVKTHLMEEKFL